MAERRPFWRRLLRFAIFRLLPLLLAAGILFFGVRIAQSVLRILSEQQQYQTRAVDYALTATHIAEQQQGTPEATAEPNARIPRDALLRRPPVVQQVFATNTPQPTLEAPTVQPAPTDIQVTPRPLPTLFIYSGPQPETAPTAIPTAVEALDRRGNDLMNIVLLGNDGEITGEDFARTDTIIILSINRTTGTVAMLSLPRDLYVYIPGWTMQRINLAYVHGEAVGWTDGGFGLLRQTLFYNLGINVHYYAMVNLTGFKALVDAVGGVNLTVDCAIQDLPLVGTEVPRGAYRVNEDGYFALPVGAYDMTGAEALWYARSRHNSSDFDRGRRQQQVIRAVWRTARDRGLLTQIPQLWNEGIQYIDTNLTLGDILGLVPIALNLDPTKIETFTLARLYHTTPWQTPDGDYVQLPVYETMRPLLEDFYTPPTQSRIVIEAASVRVFNGTTNAAWDQVAADRLQWEGFNAFVAGPANHTDYAETILIDYTGRSKGSSLEAIARTLNVRPENIRLDPRADREVDFDVIIGSNYNSCTTGGVLPVDPPQVAGDGA